MNLLGQLRRPSEPRWFQALPGRAGRFDAVATAGGEAVPVVGTRLAREGVAFISGTALREPELPFSFTIRCRTIPSRVRIVRHEPFRDAARLVHRYYCSFTAIDDEDRALVGRYVEGKPEPAGAPARGANAVSVGAQSRIAAQLIGLKRLAPSAPGMAPLIRIEPEPRPLYDERGDVRYVSVHSRMPSAAGTRAFVTRFRVHPDDRVDVLS